MKKILIAEDSPSILQILKFILEHAEYTVITAKDGQEALDKAKEEKPDLLILDFIMPLLDGDEVHLRLKEDEAFPETPVIMLTALDKEERSERGEKIKADFCLTKPFEKEELLKLVKKALGLSA